MTMQIVNELIQGAALSYAGGKREEFLSFSAIGQRPVRAASGRLAKVGRVTVPELRGGVTYTLSNLGKAPIAGTPFVNLTTSEAALWSLQEQSFAVRWSTSDEDEWRAAGLNPDEIVIAAASDVLMVATEVVTVAAMTSTSALPDGARATIWTSSSADPRDDINTAVNAIMKATGNKDRKLISVAMSVADFEVLAKHPSLLAYHALPNVGTPTVLDEMQLAQALRVGKVYVSTATYNSAADGITPAGEFVWTADDVCVYLDLPTVAGFGRQPAFARFFREGRDFYPDLISQVDHGVKSLAIMAQQQMVTVDASAAYLITGTLA